MGTIIQTSELQIGDLYREYSSFPHDRAGGYRVRKVTGQRTVVACGAQYQVLETENIACEWSYGEISLRSDRSVERLDEVDSLDNLMISMKYALLGEQFNVVYADGQYWM